MATYKLFYFPMRGAVEPVRLLFAHKEIKYEDIRLAGEDWQKEKPNTPFGVMPVLEEDGKKLGGSTVILRYLGEKHGLAGSNAWDNAHLANISDFMMDFGNELVKVHYEKDETRKQELQKRLAEEVIPKYFGKLNELTASTGYLCCGRLTWPDLQLYCVLDYVLKGHPEVLSNFSGLASLRKNIEADANISKWIKERPQTEQ
ncbi:PREDICTED: glutathione S-transferase-like [Amphimedon queenslandica]|uniref:Glutathione transferase n=1 Tax=Amphimedon queenslandica TaxID=400682 RepID=A0A1X7UUP2_AMPQE|nr:PREDICTED: glutathione S-transferase-like [Amphimedon queenslandica]|eukprot:XP_003386765.1 PREDICTED: glutathione S-transferase-like [Amphimedon queenslandica]